MKRSTAFIFIVTATTLVPIFFLVFNWYEKELITVEKNKSRIQLNLFGNSIANTLLRRSALFEGLCSYVESNPFSKNLEMELDRLMISLYNHSDGVRVMAVAPGGIQKYVHPLKGHESVVGHDILHDKRPHVQTDIQRVLKTKKIIFSGPYELRQGGLALGMRKAIFFENEFWGLASMVIDVPPILEEAGMKIRSEIMEISLKNKNGILFWGSGSAFLKNSIKVDLDTLDGKWELAGFPVNGWKPYYSKKLLIYQISTACILFLVLTVLYLLISQNQVLRNKIKKATVELSKSFNELKKSEKEYRVLYNSTPVMMHSIGKDQLILSVSDLWLEKLGYDREQVIGKKSLDFLSDESKKMAVEVNMPKLIQQGSVNDIPYQFAKKNGDILDVLLSAICEKDKEGEIIHSLAVLIDVTEKKQLEARLLQSQKMESIGTLAGGIAHDFNNILYPIIGFTEMSMQDLPKTHMVQENLKDILEGAKRASKLVKQILKFSRQEKQVLKPMVLKPIVEEALRLLRSTIPANIDIQSYLADQEEYVLCDATEIHEIVMNLCTNAYHSVEENGGTITVRLNKQNPLPDLKLPLGEYICLSVSDNGVGIPQDIIEKIFEPYLTTKELGKGSGLGLSVVHGIVTNYAGNISVESAPGKGSVFSVFLPLTSQLKSVEKEQEKRKIIGGTESILFVDDEESIVKLGTRILERLGYTITGKKSCIEALKLFKENPDRFDLIITDMAMPIMTGTDFAKEVLKIQPDMSIIICTGFSENLDLEIAKSVGIKEYIKKPLLTDEMTSKIREVLDQSSK
jgi:PAS domain S-box-containing protein